MSKLQDCIVRALQTLEPYVEELNAMNVFPIPDKDTGRNLYKTLEIAKNPNPEKDLRLQFIMASRGTSGTILSTFFHSWPLELSDETLPELRQALTVSETRLNKAICNLQHGTIYDAMTAWPPQQINSILEFFELWLYKIEDGIMKGPDILPILDEYGTLDSGAIGFYYIINGIATELGLNYPMKHFYVERAHMPWRQSDSRYCVEALLTNIKDQSYISEAVWGFGSSLIIITDPARPDFLKLHIHCDRPEKVKGMCQQAGTIIDWKVDDMKKASEN